MSSFLSSSSRYARALLVTAMTVLVVPACGGDNPSPPLSTSERQELERQLAGMQSTIDELRAQLTRYEQDGAAAQQEKEQLTAQLADVQQQLAEARELLATQDWDGVLVKLDAANEQVRQLQARLAATHGDLTLNAALFFGGQPLALDTPYGPPEGELSFTELRYWLSNVRLQKQNGTQVALPDSYYLIEAIKEQPVLGIPETGSGPVMMPANRRERVQVPVVPAGIYTGITFSVGVDPTYNDNLSRQAGELHVLKNMANETWMWFTSYIFTKVKGQYVRADGSSAEFGWETGTNDDFRTVRHVFPAPVTVNAQKALIVNLRLDTARLFTGLHPTTQPLIGASNGVERATLSDNFANGFSLTSVENPNR
ncbi:hypothetical protein CYFUS_008823 [Cystobacter fuscus]|uniref:Copper-binding protein MbnP-like domain-containing protein n=1 Tax=Cystobacter fuscus TaxID=43 RepID=A0A250JI85_9BACT|nr:hypothetical protein CYFUS_008823 [Cystobacter fuscus]